MPSTHKAPGFAPAQKTKKLTIDLCNLLAGFQLPQEGESRKRRRERGRERRKKVKKEGKGAERKEGGKEGRKR